MDTNVWIRNFEQGSIIINSQREAVGDILESHFDIISSKFQIKQLSHLIQNELNADKKIIYQSAKDLCELTCPNSSKRFTLCRMEAQRLFTTAQLNDFEDALQIIIASMSGAEFFITADDDLYQTKKHTIERLVPVIVSSITHNLQIVDPVEFKRITRI
ncbi:MAG: hypothetical protein QXE82_04295 [Candidatus Nitrosotenuis sp.]